MVCGKLLTNLGIQRGVYVFVVSFHRFVDIALPCCITLRELEMKTHLILFSVVIVGGDHNPTILNPDFLTIREIVPKEWGWEVADPAITTPPFAIVRYTNGTSITVERNKLQVADSSASNDPTD